MPLLGAPPDSPRVDRNLTVSAVTSNEARVWPSCPCHRRGLPVFGSAFIRPSTSTFEPFFRYSLDASALLPNTDTRHQMVRSCCWPSCPVHFSLVAMEKLVTAAPEGVYLISCAMPNFTTRITMYYIRSIFLTVAWVLLS